jgi:hypothetical protein
VSFSHNFETRPGLAGRPGAGTGAGWRKNRKRKNLVWPGRLNRRPGKTRLQTRWLLIFFVFFTKTTSFWFKKKLTRPTRSKPGTRALDRAGHRCKPIDFFFIIFLLKQCRFDLKKELTRPTRWPDYNQESEPWTGPGLKTMILVVEKKKKFENNLENSESRWHFSSLMSSGDFI